MRKFYHSEKPITIEDIQEVEQKYNVRFPKPLKKLLLQYNGGTLDLGMVYIHGKPEKYAFGSLSSIKYGPNKIEDTIEYLQIIEQHIPREEIPFADDQGGNIYTISTRPEDYGKIYIWYMDVGEPRREFVANSLEEFFTGKKGEEEEENS